MYYNEQMFSFSFTIGEGRPRLSGTKLTIQKGGGVLMLAALLPLLPLMDILKKHGEGRPITGWDIFGLTLFSLVGMGMAFGRSGVVIDRDAHTLTEWWGLTFFNFEEKVTDLSGVHEVLLQKETTQHKESSSTVYGIYLLVGQGKVAWAAPGSYLAARRQAKELARFLNVALEDKNTGNRREPDELDLSLGQILKKHGDQPKLTAQPESTHLRSQSDETGVTFEAPVRIGLEGVLGLVVPVLFVAYIWDKNAITGRLGPSGYQYLQVAVVLWVVAMVAWRLKTYFTHRVIWTLTPTHLNHRTAGSTGGKVSIPLSELNEIDVMENGKFLEARSDKQIASFTGRLREDEVYWMRDTLEHYIYKY